MAGAFQYAPVSVQYLLLVLHQQDNAPFIHLLTFLTVKRQAQRYHCACAVFTLYAKLPSMTPRDLPADGKPQAHSLGRDGYAPLENPRHKLRRYALPAVPYDDAWSFLPSPQAGIKRIRRCPPQALTPATDTVQ